MPFNLLKSAFRYSNLFWNAIAVNKGLKIGAIAMSLDEQKWVRPFTSISSGLPTLTIL